MPILSVYQEVRLPLRLALLKVFGALCGLESSIIAHLLYSILPLELVSEILHHNQGQYNTLLQQVSGILHHNQGQHNLLLLVYIKQSKTKVLHMQKIDIPLWYSY